jgi:hypothetical protein
MISLSAFGVYCVFALAIVYAAVRMAYSEGYGKGFLDAVESLQSKKMKDGRTLNEYVIGGRKNDN